MNQALNSDGVGITKAHKKAAQIIGCIYYLLWLG